MKLKKISYFPYLPNSRVEDNKRYKIITNMMEKNPFAFHKRKNEFLIFDKRNFKLIHSQNYTTDLTNDINTKTPPNPSNPEQDTLIFQQNHDKYMNLYNKFMKKKTTSIETNTQNYVNYLLESKKQENHNNFKSLSPTSNSQVLNSMNSKNSIPSMNDNAYTQRLSLGKRTPSDSNIFSQRKIDLNEPEKNNFVASIKTKKSDITNPFFYNDVAKEIMKLNIETQDYNKKESEKKYTQKKNNLRYYNSQEELPLEPNKINNPNYYNIGESNLDINPIINKGNYSMSYVKNYNNFKRQKSYLY